MTDDEIELMSHDALVRLVKSQQREIERLDELLTAVGRALADKRRKLLERGEK